MAFRGLLLACVDFCRRSLSRPRRRARSRSSASSSSSPTTKRPGHRRSAALHGHPGRRRRRRGTHRNTAGCLRHWSQTRRSPVSGSLGLLAKAAASATSLIAALYAHARYDGVVDITIAGKPLDSCRRTPSSAPGRCRWRSRSTRLGVHAGRGGAQGRCGRSVAGRVRPARGGDAGSDAILKAESADRATAEGRRQAACHGHEPRRGRRPCHHHPRCDADGRGRSDRRLWRDDGRRHPGRWTATSPAT